MKYDILKKYYQSFYKSCQLWRKERGKEGQAGSQSFVTMGLVLPLSPPQVPLPQPQVTIQTTQFLYNSFLSWIFKIFFRSGYKILSYHLYFIAINYHSWLPCSTTNCCQVWQVTSGFLSSNYMLNIWLSSSPFSPSKGTVTIPTVPAFTEPWLNSLPFETKIKTLLRFLIKSNIFLSGKECSKNVLWKRWWLIKINFFLQSIS